MFLRPADCRENASAAQFRKLDRVQYGANAPVIGPGCSGRSCGSAHRTHHVARPGWRAASPIRPDLVFRHAQVAPMIGLAATDRIANGGRAKTRYLSTSSCAGNRAAVRPPFVFAILGTVSLNRVLTNSVSFSEKRIGSPLCSTKNCGSNTLNQMPWR